ncbi:hypothetical protein MPH_07564 [Macrophomina phaseolina MS6]|uniref:Uncharacterized protein n=1 Tax=Macrophomina phaseolina (strain MS6) TaxID=1126212 RepID=K2SEE5_MACPH|nr:hypothetical protein MPH_07564 [Macrophomina phaseolina MS6]
MASSTPVVSRTATRASNDQTAKRLRPSSASSTPGPAEKKRRTGEPGLELLNAAPERTRDLVPSLEKILEEAKAQREQIHDYKTRMRLYESKVRAMQRVIDDYASGNEVNDELQAQAEKFANQLRKKAEQLEKKDGELAASFNEKTSLKKTVSVLMKQLDAEKKKSGELERVNDKLEERVKSFGDEVAELSIRRKELSKNFTEKKNEVESLRKRLETAEKRLKKAQEDIAAAHEQTEQCRQKIKEAVKPGKAAVQALEKQAGELKKEIKKLSKEDTERGKQIATLEKKVKTVEERLKMAREKKGACDICGNLTFHILLQLLSHFLEEQEPSGAASLVALKDWFEHCLKKFPEFGNFQQRGKDWLLSHPDRLASLGGGSRQEAPENRSAPEADLTRDENCAMCSNEEVAKVVYWAVQACQDPENSAFWHSELFQHIHAWHDSYANLIHVCQAGENLVQADIQRKQKEAAQRQGDTSNDEVDQEEVEEALTSKTPQEEYYIFLFRAQQILKLFAERDMHLLEFGGAFKDLKAKIDTRKKDGVSKWDFQDRLDAGRMLLEERIKFWAETPGDHGVESGESTDCTAISVELPAKLVAMMKDLEDKTKEVQEKTREVNEKKRELEARKEEAAKVRARAAEAHEDCASFSQFTKQVQDFTTLPLQKRYGIPRTVTGAPLIRRDTCHPPTQIQSTFMGFLTKDTHAEEHVGVDQGVANEAQRLSCAESLESCAMKGVCNPDECPSPISEEMADSTAKDIGCDHDGTQPTDDEFGLSQQTKESLLHSGGIQ